MAAGAASALLVGGSLTPASAASTGSTTTTTGQSFQIAITTPADGATLPLGTTSIPVGGTISIGPLPVSGTAHVAFVIDESGSLGIANFNTEKQGAVDLFNKIRATPGLDVNSSLFFFADSVETVLHDQPAADNFVTAVNGHAYSEGSTHTKDAIAAALAELSGKTGTKQIVLITDGSPNPSSQTPTAAQRTALDNAGIGVFTYAVGEDATCAPLTTISTQCTLVADFSALSGTLTGTPPAGIQGVQISVNGGAYGPVDSLTSTGQISATAHGLHPGANTVALRGTASDGTTVDASVVVHVPAPVTAPTGSKSAQPTHSERVHWTLTKTVDNGAATSHDLNLGTVGGLPTVNYRIMATKTISNETFGVTGTVTVTNTNPTPLAVTLADPGLSPAVSGSTCTLASTTGTVPAAGDGPGTLPVAYSCSFTTAPVVGTTYHNVATVTYMDENDAAVPVSVSSPNFVFPAATLLAGSDQQSVTVADPLAPASAGFPKTVSATTVFPVFQQAYSGVGCQSMSNTASFTAGASGADTAKVEYCYAVANTLASQGPAAKVMPTCRIANSGQKGRAEFSVTATAPVHGGLMQVKLHKVHTPGTAKVKVTVSSYNGPITKKLSPGTWHGTMIYIPQAGAPVTYCGIVFYNLKVK